MVTQRTACDPSIVCNKTSSVSCKWPRHLSLSDVPFIKGISLVRLNCLPVCRIPSACAAMQSSHPAQPCCRSGAAKCRRTCTHTRAGPQCLLSSSNQHMQPHLRG